MKSLNNDDGVHIMSVIHFMVAGLCLTDCVVGMKHLKMADSNLYLCVLQGEWH